MKRKKTKKLSFEDEPILQSPFASLGELGTHSKTATKTPEKDLENHSRLVKTVTRNSLLIREEKRSKGKRVTCIYHIDTSHELLFKELKKRLGAGGSITETGTLEIQGSHLDKVRHFFNQKGYKTR